jgi:hypothetical protein
MAMNAEESPCGRSNPFAAGQTKDARYVENIMEHAFLSDVLQHCWFVRHHRVEVIRPDVDAGGYDLVLDANGRIRHVQLKSRWKGGRSKVGTQILSRLRDHADPCVVSISWQANAATCRVDLQYRYSDKAKWPPPVWGASTFELTGRHFLPDFLDTPALVAELFGPAPRSPSGPESRDSS